MAESQKEELEENKMMMMKVVVVVVKTVTMEQRIKWLAIFGRPKIQFSKLFLTIAAV